jgi:pimeloyl-ACP methyl ester carboxylesterase
MANVKTGSARSADGTQIAYWSEGQGPPLVLVHGITSTHLTFDEIRPHLTPHRTVAVYDRRGRGDSGDLPEGTYDISAEYQDLLAVLVDLGTAPLDLFAHSFGAYIALGAALRDDRKLIRRMVLYSPGFGERYPEETLSEIDAQVASGDRDQALRMLLMDIIGMPEDEVEFMRQSPAWAARIESVHTVARECRADRDFPLEARTLGALSVPVLVISGETNLPHKQAVASKLAELIPGARLEVMSGEGHVAHHTAPGRLAELILDFTEGA